MEPVYSMIELALGMVMPGDGNTEWSSIALRAWNDWSEWGGKGTPETGQSQYVILKLRDGTVTGRFMPRHVDWEHSSAKDDVVAYKRSVEATNGS